MSLTRITLYGFYQFDDKLFENVTLPDGLDKSILIDCIMSKSGELYPYHQALPHLKQNIENWFARNYSNFRRQIEALQSEYNPIENYDRYEDLIEDNKRETNGSNKVETSSKSKTEGKVSAYNSNNYENSSLGESDGQAKTTTSFDTGDKSTRTNKNHIHGNIGVTTASAMISETIQLYSFDLYENIAQRFEKEFLVQVY